MKRHFPTAVVVTTLATACNARLASIQHVAFAHLAFDVPGDWSHYDTSHRGVATEVWSPDSNGDKESLTVIRTELATIAVRPDPESLSTLLTQAQTSLPDAQVSNATPVKTHSGLWGARVDVDYVPRGLRDRYHRVHAVFVDGTSLVHVMYTAKSPGAALATFDLVLSTIREGEG